jgi:hypothetical protein
MVWPSQLWPGIVGLVGNDPEGMSSLQEARIA